MTYVSEIVEFVAARRGSPTLISPGEYAAFAEWEKQGIPLSLVFGVYNVVVLESATPEKRETTIADLDAAISIKFADWLQKNKAMSA
ncbi:MAG: hypothetical protein DMF62_15750 [Acidobacteria bacterium]|nr:MAG: hypothetical protein DMF62_15750 [Acidobacteriota bacterium]